MKRLALLAVLLMGSVTFAARVTFVSPEGQIKLEYNAKYKVEVGEQICLFDKVEQITCGKITALSEKEFVMTQSDKPARLIQPGDNVMMKRVMRLPAATQASQMAMDASTARTHDVSAGIAAGFSYYFPYIQIQQQVGSSYSVGLMPLYAKYTNLDSTAEALGGFLSFNYYYSHYPFRGFYFTAAAGLYHFNLAANTLTETTNVPALLGAASWRGRAAWGVPVDIGVSLGAQYAFTNTQTIALNFSGFEPYFSAFVGYCF